MGKVAEKYVTEWMKRPEYAKLSDAGKAQTLQDALRQAYEPLGPTDRALGAQVARAPKHEALFAWAAVPHYQGIPRSTAPEKIRELNYQITQAKQMRAEYEKRYAKGPTDTYSGRVKFAAEHPELVALANRGAVPAAVLRNDRAAVDKRFGGALSEADKEGIVGAANIILD